MSKSKDEQKPDESQGPSSEPTVLVTCSPTHEAVNTPYGTITQTEGLELTRRQIAQLLANGASPSALLVHNKEEKS